MSLQQVPIPNRHGLFGALTQTIEHAKSKSLYVGLVLVDVKNFTAVNRVFGYSHGDAILFLLQKRLKELAQGNNCVFRIGSDEFALILPALDSGSRIVPIVNTVLDGMRDPYYWNSQEFHFDVNIGCVALPAETATAEQLLSSSEHLLQQGKKEGRDLKYATEVQRQDDDYIWSLEQDLLQALANNTLELFFQPKINLATGRPIHGEALLRWHHPKSGAIDADFIIRMIERLNREFELTKWVLQNSLRELKAWSDNRFKSGIAVNVPASQVHDPEFCQLVEDSLRLWRIDAQQLTLEVTEGAIMKDPENAFDNLSKIKALGVRIAIDDFGTGYSSLEYFKFIPADELKIDRFFVTNMARSMKDRHIAKLIIDLAHRFDMKVVAEGVEDANTLNLLRGIGCDFAQGYFISKPLPNKLYAQWLKSRAHAQPVVNTVAGTAAVKKTGSDWGRTKIPT